MRGAMLAAFSAWTDTESCLSRRLVLSSSVADMLCCRRAGPPTNLLYKTVEDNAPGSRAWAWEHGLPRFSSCGDDGSLQGGRQKDG